MIFGLNTEVKSAQWTGFADDDKWKWNSII